MAGRNWSTYPYNAPYPQYRSGYPPGASLSGQYGMPQPFGAPYRDDRRPDNYRMVPRTNMPPVTRKRSPSPPRPVPHIASKPSRPVSDNRYQSASHGRYDVSTPADLLVTKELSVTDLKRRFHRMYVPSDFFHGDLGWQFCFPIIQPYTLDKACDFHIFNKDVDNPHGSIEYDNMEYLEPADADYTYSAKVMLLSGSDLATLYQKTIRMAEEKPGPEKHNWMKELHFLVGTKGKSEVMAIGGPWSPSLDGPDPADDPQVLINTAIRHCKALTGIDLSGCSHWYKFLELHYYRHPERIRSRKKPDTEGNAEETGDKNAAGVAAEPSQSRVETVAIFLPDIHSCMPAIEDWKVLCNDYKEQLEMKLAPPKAEPELDASINVPKDVPLIESLPGPDAEATEENVANETSLQEGDTTDGKATHYSKLDVPNMKVAQLRAELDARSIDSKGLKSQLVAKLESVIKEEERKEAKEKETVVALEKQENTMEIATAEAPVTKELTEKDRKRLERLYRLEEKIPSILVHPSRKARAGDFSCEKISLHSLLEYRLDDQKETTFEVSLFVEQFRDMIQRDSAFNIYKALVVAPEPIPEKSQDTDEPSSKRRRGDTAGSNGRKAKRTVNPDLLFSFNIFDNGCAEYIKEADMEAIVLSLGLNLSRSQIRKLINKVMTRKDGVYYRKITDKEVQEGIAEDFNALNAVLDDADYIEELSLGNRVLLEEVKRDKELIICTCESDLIVKKLQNSEDRKREAEFGFHSLRETMVSTRKELNEAKDAEDKARAEAKKLNDELTKDLDHLKEVRSTNRVYRHLLEGAHEYSTRIYRNIEKQFEKKEEPKEDKPKEDPMEAEVIENGKVGTKIVDECMKVVDSA